MKFHDCATAPSPRRIRILLAEKGVEIETVQVDLRNGEHLQPAFAEINPWRTVPVLELDDGTRLCDSNAISIYLDETFPEPNLLGRTPLEKAVIAMWNQRMVTEGFMSVADCFRNTSKGMQGRALTGPVNYDQIPALAERGRQRVKNFFAELDARLGQHAYIAGDRFTAADISALVTVDFSRIIKEPIPDGAAHLRRWHASVSARPGAVA